jgi:hypothetical protein
VIASFRTKAKVFTTDEVEAINGCGDSAQPYYSRWPKARRDRPEERVRKLWA